MPCVHSRGCKLAASSGIGAVSVSRGRPGTCKSAAALICIPHSSAGSTC